MHEQAYLTNLIEFSNERTRSIDLVASWETFNQIYDSLKFTDELADEERLNEYKWITHQMNKFLSRTRKQMITCQNWEAILQLMESIKSPQNHLDSRAALVFQKLRMEWIRTTALQAQQTIIMNQMDQEETNGEW